MISMHSALMQFMPNTPIYSLWVRNNDFHKLPGLAQGIGEVRQQDKKFLLPLNRMPHNTKLKTYMTDMEPVIAMGPEAPIMVAPGLIMLARYLQG